jgi:hypothetical protein
MYLYFSMRSIIPMYNTIFLLVYYSKKNKQKNVPRQKTLKTNKIASHRVHVAYNGPLGRQWGARSVIGCCHIRSTQLGPVVSTSRMGPPRPHTRPDEAYQATHLSRPTGAISPCRIRPIEWCNIFEHISNITLFLK